MRRRAAVVVAPSDCSVLGYRTDAAVTLARALHAVGATDVLGLELIAPIWRNAKISPDMPIDELEHTNQNTLEVWQNTALALSGTGKAS